MHSEWIHPKTIGAFGIARCDVPGYAFVESESGKKPECAREANFAMLALFVERGENRRGSEIGAASWSFDHSLLSIIASQIDG
jgi:hypothetical protein